MDELKPIRPKKGDILRNGWTSKANAFHLSVFVKCGKVGNQKTFDCIGYDGSIVHLASDDNKLKIVGHMAEYDAFLDALRKLNRREDLIDRAELEKHLNSRLDELRAECGDYDPYVDGFDECVSRVEDFKSAQPEEE